MSISALNPNFAALNADPPLKQGEAELKEKFRDFTAGTIFKQMLKSLRKMHDEPAYLNGGQAEKTFRSMLDDKVAEEMTKTHGSAISDPLFETFRGRIPVSNVAAGEARAEKS